MVDTVSKRVRSRIMSRVRGKNTGPELLLRKALSALGLRYKKNYRMGRKAVDIAFPGKKVAVFVDGCFWHKCPRCFRPPTSNKRYWGPKIARNVERDQETDKRLRKDGRKVLRFWEHQVKTNPQRCAQKVKRAIPSYR